MFFFFELDRDDNHLILSNLFTKKIFPLLESIYAFMDSIYFFILYGLQSSLSIKSYDMVLCTILQNIDFIEIKEIDSFISLSTESIIKLILSIIHYLFIK